MTFHVKENRLMYCANYILDERKIRELLLYKLNIDYVHENPAII